MADLGKNLSAEKISEIESFLITRFRELDDAKKALNGDLSKEIDCYNNLDQKQVDETETWEERVTIPLVYSNVQTAKAKLLSELFAVDNYIKIYIEDEKLRPIQEKVNSWVQKEVDKTGLDRLAKDFLEDALVQRVSWVHIRALPVQRKKHIEDGSIDILDGYKVDLQVYKMIDVWFDIKATNVMKTDFFVRKSMKLWELKRIPAYSMNFDRVLSSAFPDMDYDEVIRQRELDAKHSSSGVKVNIPKINEAEMLNKEVEIMEYMGVIDIGEGSIFDPDYKPEMKEVIITWVNRSVIVAIQENNISTTKKRLMFPIRPLRQANSLLGKGIPQLTKDMQHLFNRYQSLSHQNAMNIVKGTIFFDTNSEIDIDDLFIGGGNMIPVDGNPSNAVFPYPHQNIIGMLHMKSEEQKSNIQQSIGTVDVITGAGGNIPDTASGQRSLTEQANFKFMMMGDNVSDDLSDVIKYIIITLLEYDKPNQMLWNTEIADFLEQPISDLEDTNNFDIALKDLTSRRDVEQNQWANLVTLLAPILQQVGGDVSLLISYLMDVFQVPDKEAILKRGNPQEIAQKMASDPQLASAVMEMLNQIKGQNQTGGGAEQNSPSVPDGTAVEKASVENLKT